MRANGEPFGVFVFAAVGFAVGRVEEKPPAPHSRLAYIHLHHSFAEIITAKKE
jgi:dTDP-glucose pyrophosphorylase